MIDIKYTNATDLSKKMGCEISNLSKVDVIEVNGISVDEMGLKWESNFRPTVKNGSCCFTIDDIVLNLQHKGFGKFKLTSSIFEIIRKLSIPRSDFVTNYTKFINCKLNYIISIRNNGEIVDNREIFLEPKAFGIEIEDINSNFVGKYFYKPNEERPNIIVISGSMGDFYWSELVASILTNYGFNTLAISYFSYRSKGQIPKNLTSIELEYFNEAIHWMESRSRIKKNIGIIGFSKGAEAALLLGSKNNESISSIVAISPSAYSFEGAYLGKAKQIGSWCYKGNSVDFLKYDKGSKFSPLMKPGYLFNIHKDAIEKSDPIELEKTRIKVELIKAKTLLISGGRDLTWPSKAMCEVITNKNPNIMWRNYKNMGHIFTVPNIPIYLESKKHSYESGYKENNEAWESIVEHLYATMYKP